jgi:AAA15 family ATPase/GTPase
MFSRVIIKNFKSIKELVLNPKRINLFIGKPNTGKSNILEALGVFSLPYVNGNLRELVRLEKIVDVFWDNQTSLKIEVIADSFRWEAFTEGNLVRFRETGTFQFFDLCFDTWGNQAKSMLSETPSPFKFYRFKSLLQFPRKEFAFLLPPTGENLLAILNTHPEIYNLVNLLLKEFNLEMGLDEPESKIRILKPGPPKAIFFPYSSLSDTLQRTVFYFAAIKSNKDSILLFEEPESHAFPYYTKILAEAIALDKANNQYFISTHNPYFLLPIIEKTPKNELAIFYVDLKDYQTIIKELSEEEKEKILKREIDAFFQFI